MGIPTAECAVMAEGSVPGQVLYVRPGETSEQHLVVGVEPSMGLCLVAKARRASVAEGPAPASALVCYRYNDLDVFTPVSSQYKLFLLLLLRNLSG